MKRKDIFLSLIALASVSLLAPEMAKAQALIVKDSGGQTLGPLLTENHVGLTIDGTFVSVRFKTPGFNTMFENNQTYKVFYTTADCTGTIYYSDQAIGTWQDDAYPSIFDAPLKGILVGKTVSTLDPNYSSDPDHPKFIVPEYYSLVDVYYPDPSAGLQLIDYKSMREYGRAGVQSCGQATGTGKFATLKKSSRPITITPPLSVSYATHR